MEPAQEKPFDGEKLSQEVLQEWQSLLDVVSEIFRVPAGLITRVSGPEIEILLSSRTEGNPYPEGAKARFPDSGWYCESTLKKKGLLQIPNALQDPEWKDNAAAVDQHMISYIGLPISLPDGGMFGTICFIDDKENAHNSLLIKLLHQARRTIELSLRIIADRRAIADRDRLLDDLSRIYPICAYCKRVRQDSGAWVEVEQYVSDISGNQPSHGICPQCHDKVKQSLKKR